MIYAPHTLYRLDSVEVRDEFGRIVEKTDKWVEVGRCRCVDNNTQKQISVNGKDYTYSYQINFDAPRIAAGAKIKVTGREEAVEGEVIASARYNYFNHSVVWL